MGLDITYYRRLSAAPVQTITDWEPDHPGGMAFRPNDDFPGREEGIPALVCVGECVDGFRAGSYGGYNAWREQLAKLAGYPATECARVGDVTEQLHAAACWQGATGPFSELINFSDCEGVIGPVVSAKLAADFDAFFPQAQAIGGDFFDRYCKWRDAFKTAADGGAVDFH